MRGTAFQKGGNLLDVGEKIRYLRLKKRWTQKHLAGLLGVDKSTISQYETYMRTPSYKILVKLCYIFQVSADFLSRRACGSRIALFSGWTDRVPNVQHRRRRQRIPQSQLRRLKSRHFRGRGWQNTRFCNAPPLPLQRPLAAEQPHDQLADHVRRHHQEGERHHPP